MSDNASAYFSAIRTEQARLERAFPDGFLYVYSIKNLMANSTAGTVSQVTTRQAAKHLCEATARVATPDEIAEFHARAQAYIERLQSQAYVNHKRHDSSGVTHIIREK